MKREKIEQFRAMLLQQRQALFDEVSSLETNLQEIATDREPEIEEAAQAERAALLLDRLDARGKFELEELDRALARIEAGEYGQCLSCHQAIAAGRLHALPATAYCRDCAEEIARDQTTERETAEPVHTTPVPDDYSLLTGRELEDAIRDHLRDDGRVDMEGLRLVCRHGVVHNKWVCTERARAPDRPANHHGRDGAERS